MWSNPVHNSRRCTIFHAYNWWFLTQSWVYLRSAKFEAFSRFQEWVSSWKWKPPRRFEKSNLKVMVSLFPMPSITFIHEGIHRCLLRQLGKWPPKRHLQVTHPWFFTFLYLDMMHMFKLSETKQTKFESKSKKCSFLGIADILRHIDYGILK